MSGGDRWHISFHEGLGFRASPTLHTMFYSVDLLSLKGGRMNMIWLLGTQRLGKPVLSEMDEFDVFRLCTYLKISQGQDCSNKEEEGGVAQD